jgi:hypothetical protein
MRKINFLMLIVGLCMALLISGCASPATKKVDPKDVVMNAYQKLASLKNYHASMDVTSSFMVKDKNVNMVMKGEMDIQQKPMMFKNTLNIISDTGSQKLEQKIVQYAEESGNQLIVYSNLDNKWVKQAMDKADCDPIKDFDNYFKGITSVTQKSEDGDAVTYEVVVSGSYVKEKLQKAVESMGMKNLQITDERMKSLGDFKYTVKIDKKTSNISKIDIDLSSFMAKLGESLAQDQSVPDDQKQMIKDIFSSMKTSSSMTLSQFDSVGEISIPAEAKK